MNNQYPIWWDAQVTIYNRFENPLTQEVTWYRKVVSNCFWRYTRDQAFLDKATVEKNYVVCRIPKDARYKDSKEWQTLEDKSKAFTLQPGDIIVKGEVDEVIDEYTSEKHSTDFVEKYKSLQGCIKIDEMNINTGPGRCCEHYSIIGR